MRPRDLRRPKKIVRSTSAGLLQTVFDAGRTDNKQRLELLVRGLAVQEETFTAVREAAEPVFDRQKKFAPPTPDETPPPPPPEGPAPTAEEIAAKISEADAALVKLERLPLPKALRWSEYAVWILILSALLGAGLYFAAALARGDRRGRPAAIVIGIVLSGPPWSRRRSGRSPVIITP